MLRAVPPTQAPRPVPDPAHPCPGCGWGVPADAVLCTRCGQRLRAEAGGGRAATRVEPAQTPPSLAPVPGSIRWRNARMGEFSERIPMLKCAIWLVAGLGATLVMRALNPGPEDLLPYLGRFGILVACGIALVIAARMTFIDTQASALVLVLAVAGSLAGADMAQHLIRDFLLAIALTAWPVAIVLCAGLITDLLDIELTEGAFLGVALIALKFILKITLFEQILTPP